VNGFIDHLHALLGSTSIYNTITTARVKSSQSDLTSRFLVKGLNNGNSSASVLPPLPAG
jgi:hypothetical protein